MTTNSIALSEMFSYEGFKPFVNGIHKIVDKYKLGHVEQYINGEKVLSEGYIAADGKAYTKHVYANLTTRDNKYAQVMINVENNDTKLPHFLQPMLRRMMKRWELEFFSQPKDDVVKDYANDIKGALGPDKGDKQIDFIAKLHDVGYLPLKIKSLPDGSYVNKGIPVATIINTRPDAVSGEDFESLVNYIETYFNCNYWPSVDAAAVARQYWRNSVEAAEICKVPEWVPISNHNFACRGGRTDGDSTATAIGASMFSLGSDTFSVIGAMREGYGDKNGFYGDVPAAVSVNSTEHATTTQRIAFYGNEGLGFSSLLDIYPKGILSYVADSKDLFGFLANEVPKYKDKILARENDELGLCKVVFRPDSSPKTPKEIIVGDNYFYDTSGKGCEAVDFYKLGEVWEKGYRWLLLDTGEYAKFGDDFDYEGYRDWSGMMTVDDCFKSGYLEVVSYEDVPLEVLGVLQILKDTFKTTVSESGFEQLNPKVGMIYGEAINTKMHREILQELIARGWCVSNCLFGIGSYGFLAGATRDRFGLATKGTFSIVEVDGNLYDLPMQKNPKTADSFKKSAIGLLRVEKEGEDYVLYDNQTADEESQGELKLVYADGVMFNQVNLDTVRSRFGFI